MELEHKIIDASALREKASKKIVSDAKQLSDWIRLLAADITSWCNEEAVKGAMSCKLDSKDLRDLLIVLPEDKIGVVIYGATAILMNHGYRVSVEEGDPTSKPQNSINSIDIDWHDYTKTT